MSAIGYCTKCKQEIGHIEAACPCVIYALVVHNTLSKANIYPVDDTLHIPPRVLYAPMDVISISFSLEI